MRRLLYACLLSEFGPHRDWSGSRYPRDRRTEFHALLTKLAGVFSTLTGKTITRDAVEQQVDWGITVQKEIKSNGHARAFIMNKAAALDVGFITTADLPAFMSVGKHGSLSAQRKKILDQL